MKRSQLHWVRPNPYRWGFVDFALFSIPLAGVVLAAIGKLAGWA